MKLVIFGNSGAGKSTLAAAMATRHGLSHLDLDTMVWEPGKIAIPRSTEVVMAELQAFLDEHATWVIEGCYGALVKVAAASCSKLVFLNPGRETCLTHNQRRPWEPHKYASRKAQDTMLPNLQAWVAGYYERDDDWSYARHRQIFDGHQGPKHEQKAACTPENLN